MIRELNLHSINSIIEEALHRFFPTLHAQISISVRDGGYFIDVYDEDWNHTIWNKGILPEQLPIEFEDYEQFLDNIINQSGAPI